MSAEKQNNEMKSLLRQYLLDTIEPDARRRVEALLAASSEWRNAIESERARLAQLDLLRDVPPPKNAASKIMAEIHDIEEAKAQPSVTSQFANAFIKFGVATFMLLVVAAIILPALGRARESARRASPQNNLKQMGLVFKMYANESPGLVFPPLGDYPGMWMADLTTLYPEYLSDLSVLCDPSSENGEKLRKELEKPSIDLKAVAMIAGKDMVYLGTAVADEADIQSLAKARASGADLTKDIVLPKRTLYRLREGIARFLITDTRNPAAVPKVESEIPIMFNASYVHVPKGKNVLYLDGHVSFVRYGQFPVTRAVDEALGLPTE